MVLDDQWSPNPLERQSNDPKIEIQIFHDCLLQQNLLFGWQLELQRRPARRQLHVIVEHSPLHEHFIMPKPPTALLALANVRVLTFVIVFHDERRLCNPIIDAEMQTRLKYDRCTASFKTPTCKKKMWTTNEIYHCANINLWNKLFGWHRSNLLRSRLCKRQDPSVLQQSQLSTWGRSLRGQMVKFWNARCCQHLSLEKENLTYWHVPSFA